MRINLTYFDENESFGRALPEPGVVGTVVRRISLGDWGNDWSLLELERPFEYQARQHHQVLIRSRWQGHTVGGVEPTSVFVLLVPDPGVLEKESFTSEDFEHVAWGMAATVS